MRHFGHASIVCNRHLARSPSCELESCVSSRRPQKALATHQGAGNASATVKTAQACTALLAEGRLQGQRLHIPERVSKGVGWCHMLQALHL